MSHARPGLRATWQRRLVCLALVTAASGWLGGCATPRGPDDAQVSAPAPAFAGRLALQVDGQPERSLAADFELFGTATVGELVLTGPLGSTAARARWQPGEAWLVTAQGESRHADLDSLAEQALGERLPMAALFDWLRGRPWAGAASSALPADGIGFAQLGWSVALDRLAEGRITLRRDGSPSVTVRLRLLPAG